MTDKESIIEFPIQKRKWHDESMSDSELIQNVRLSVTRMLNLKAAGKYELNLEDIKGILKVNNICLELGYPPIVNDISQLQ